MMTNNITAASRHDFQGKPTSTPPIQKPRYWRSGLTRTLKSGMRVERITRSDGLVSITGWAFGVSHFRIGNDFERGHQESMDVQTIWSDRLDVQSQHSRYLRHSQVGFEIRFPTTLDLRNLAIFSSPLEIKPLAVFEISEMFSEDVTSENVQQSLEFLKVESICDGAIEIGIRRSHTWKSSHIDVECSIISGNSQPLLVGRFSAFVVSNPSGERLRILIGPVILFGLLSESGHASISIAHPSSESSLTLPLDSLFDETSNFSQSQLITSKSSTTERFPVRVQELVVSDRVDLHLVVGAESEESVETVLTVQKSVVGGVETYASTVHNHDCDITYATSCEGGSAPILIVAKAADELVVGVDIVAAPWLYLRGYRDVLIANNPRYWRSIRSIEYAMLLQFLERGSRASVVDDYRSPKLRIRHFYWHQIEASSQIMQLTGGILSKNQLTMRREIEQISILVDILKGETKGDKCDAVVIHDFGTPAPDLEVRLVTAQPTSDDWPLRWSAIARDSRDFKFHLPPSRSLSSRANSTSGGIFCPLDWLRDVVTTTLSTKGLPISSLTVEALQDLLGTVTARGSAMRFFGTDRESGLNYGSQAENRQATRVRNSGSTNKPWSVVISFRDSIVSTVRAAESLLNTHEGTEFEFVLIDNLSSTGTSDEICELIAGLQGTVRIRSLSYPYRFNHSAQTNLGVECASNSNVLIMSNDAVFQTTRGLSFASDLLATHDIISVGFTIHDTARSGKVQMRRFQGRENQFNNGTFTGLAIEQLNLGSNPLLGLGIPLRKFSEVPSFANLEVLQVGGNSFECVAVDRSRFLSSGGLSVDQYPTDFNDVNFALRTVSSGMRHVALGGVYVAHSPLGSRASLPVDSYGISLAAHPMALDPLIWETIHRL